VWKCLGYEFVDRGPEFGFLNRSALAYSACKIGIFTPVRQETLSRIAEIGRGLIRCSKKHTTSRKRKSKENSFSGKTGEADSEMLVGRPLTLVWFYAVENGIGFLRR
jgi:hypothetical protein